jgi:hypothetical protein
MGNSLYSVVGIVFIIGLSEGKEEETSFYKNWSLSFIMLHKNNCVKIVTPNTKGCVNRYSILDKYMNMINLKSSLIQTMHINNNNGKIIDNPFLYV